MTRPRFVSRGQIVIPALFIFPTLMVFVFLIYETAKLSREKIRHQFAIDAAAFVETTNYSDFLNRSAYVNGAFPMRIFREGFHDTTIDCQGRTPRGTAVDMPCPGNLDDILYHDGAFPRDNNNLDGEPEGAKQWPIAFVNSGLGNSRNSDSPDIPNPLVIIALDTVNYFWINWDDAQSIYKLYVQIYQLLGSVESVQFSVLKRLSDGHNFLKKSYWLNTGGDNSLFEAGGAVSSYNVSASDFMGSVQFHCAQSIMFYGNQLTHEWAQPYRPVGPQSPTSRTARASLIS